MFGVLFEHYDSNPHYLSRLIKLLNHFISIEPEDKPEGFECHHIVPKSWKSEWSKEPDNLLKVPAKAHYVIHHLMWKAFPDDVAMCIAFFMTSKGQQKQRITAKVYEKLKLEHSMSMSKSQNGKPRSEETKLLISIASSGKNNGMYGKKHSEETKKKWSELRKRKTGS